VCLHYNQACKCGEWSQCICCCSATSTMQYLLRLIDAIPALRYTQRLCCTYLTKYSANITEVKAGLQKNRRAIRQYGNRKSQA
jgi:hypothetical protein